MNKANMSENFTSNQKLKSDALDKLGCKKCLHPIQSKQWRTKVLGHTIVTSQLGSAVRSHAVETETVATTQKLQFTHTHTGREINANKLSQ
jgi:hypothetical protein